MDETDVDPSELFVAIGMLVLESRLPTASVKGRRDGLHCPQAVGHWSSHECDVAQSQVSIDLQLFTDVGLYLDGVLKLKLAAGHLQPFTHCMRSL